MKILFVLLTLLLFVSCKDNNPVGVVNSSAVLSWTGPYEVDGCGFILTIGSTDYKVENEMIIPNELKKSGTINVVISYESLQKHMAYSCGDLPKPVYYPVIKLISIKAI